MPTWEIAAIVGIGVSMGTGVTNWPIGGWTLSNATEAAVQTKVYSSYTWANLYTRCLTFAAPTNPTVRSRIGSVNGAMLVTITGTGVFQDTVNTDSLVDQNLINWQTDNTGGGAKTWSVCGSTLQDTGTNITLVSCRGDIVAQAFGQTLFCPIVGRFLEGATSTTEAKTQYTLRRATTYSNFRVYVSTNGLDGATTWRPRVNLADGSQLLTIGPGGADTGAFEDTTNTDAVAVASEVNYELDTTASTVSNLTTTLAQMKHTSVGREVGYASPASNAIGTDNAYGGAEADGTLTATETNTQIAARAAFGAKNLMVNIFAHSGAAADYFLRVNTTNSALTVNIPASSTGIFEDTANSVSVAVTDLYNYFRTIPGLATIDENIIGMEQEPDDAISDLPQGKLNVLLRM